MRRYQCHLYSGAALTIFNCVTESSWLYGVVATKPVEDKSYECQVVLYLSAFDLHYLFVLPVWLLCSVPGYNLGNPVNIALTGGLDSGSVDFVAVRVWYDFLNVLGFYSTDYPQFKPNYKQDWAP